MTATGNRWGRRDVLKKGALVTGAVIVGGTASTGTAAAGIGDGRVGHYHLNNLKGKGKVKSKVHDASPEKNHGENNGAELAKGEGRVGSALEFAGNNPNGAHSGDWVEINHTILDGASQGTVAGWFKADEVDTAGGIFGHRLGLNVERGGLTFRILDPGFSSYSDGGVELIINGWEGASIEVPLDYADDEWHHVAGVYDGSSGKVYIDGTFEDDVDYSEELKPYDVFEIGRYKWGDQGDEWYFDGLVDEVRIYDRDLTDDEIQDLASMGSETE